MCILLWRVGLYPSGAPSTIYLTTPISNNFVSWQGAANGGIYNCLGPTPVTNRTWGQIKTLYR